MGNNDYLKHIQEKCRIIKFKKLTKFIIKHNEDASDNDYHDLKEK